MQGLETFPAQFGNETNGATEEYEHARKFLTTKDDRNKKCGTLSQSEWDAACKYYYIEQVLFTVLIHFVYTHTALYIVFAFRKMKKQWNDKGEPEFV